MPEEEVTYLCTCKMCGHKWKIIRKVRRSIQLPPDYDDDNY
jgi:hypothetical protein